MPSPLGHTLAGYALARLMAPGSRTGTVQTLTAANLPDLDYLVGFATGEGGRAHGGPSHSLGAALLCGAAAGLLTPGKRFGATFGLVTAAYTSHVLLDYLSKVAPDEEDDSDEGVPLLWPLTSRRFAAPRQVFLTIETTGRRALTLRRPLTLRRLLNRHNARALLREAAALLPAVALVEAFRRR